jgi:hypothetical protein
MLQFFLNTLVFDFQKSGYMFSYRDWYSYLRSSFVCFLNMLHIQTPVTHTHYGLCFYVSKALP